MWDMTVPETSWPMMSLTLTSSNASCTYCSSSANKSPATWVIPTMIVDVDDNDDGDDGDGDEDDDDDLFIPVSNMVSAKRLVESENRELPIKAVIVQALNGPCINRVVVVVAVV